MQSHSRYFVERHTTMIESARDLGPQFVDNPHRMVGQDGAYSIPLADGRCLWYFGDTLIGERPDRSLYRIFRECPDGKIETGAGPFEQMITNTGLLMPHQTGEGGLTDFAHILDGRGRLKKLVPSLDAEDAELQRVWCMHGIELGDRIYLGYMLVLMHKELAHPDDMGFEVLGSGLARGRTTDWSFTRIGGGKRMSSYEDTIWWDVTEPQFGAAMLHDGDANYVYFFGSLQGGEHPAQTAHLARVRPSDIERLGRFEYFDGQKWSTQIDAAAPLFSGQPNELSVSFNGHLNRYLAVHSWSLTGEIVGRTADELWGPWSDPVVLWEPPQPDRSVPDGEPPKSFYAAKEHPALAGDGGRVLYITYVDNYEYFPHLIEVTLQ